MASTAVYLTCRQAPISLPKPSTLSPCWGHLESTRWCLGAWLQIGEKTRATMPSMATQMMAFSRPDRPVELEQQAESSGQRR